MALNFLTGLDVQGNIDLNKKELQNAVIQNLATDPSVGSSIVGQIIFNTTDDTLKQFVDDADGLGNPGWIEVGTTSGVETVTTTDGTYINLTPNSATSGNVTVTADLSAVDGTAVSGTRFLSKDNTWDVPAFPTPPTVNNGTLTMTTSTGLDGGATFTANQSGNSTFAVTLDLNELPVGGTLVATDQLIALNGTVESRQLISDIPLSIFDNDVPFLTSGDLPTVSNAAITLTAGAGLAAGGGGVFTLNQSSSETISFDLDTVITGGVKGSTNDSVKIDTITVDDYGRITAVATGATGQVNTVVSGNTATLSHTGTINKTLTPVTAAVANNGTALATGDQIYDFVTGQIANIPSGLAFEGNWNAATDTPDLSGATPDNGQFWICTVAGSTNLDGITDWKVGDWAIYVSTGAGTDGWQKIDNTSTLSGSGVAGQVSFWTGTANVAGDAGLTYDSASNNLTVGNKISAGGSIFAVGGDSDEWNTSYDNMITNVAVAGNATKTITLTQQDGGTLTANWTDNDTEYVAMTATTLGLGKLEDNTTQAVAANSVSSTASRTYGIQMNASDQLVVNVPWTDSTPVDTVDESTANNLKGISVNPTTGNVKVGLDINGLTEVQALADADTVPIYDAGTNKKVSVSNIANAVLERTSYSQLGPSTTTTIFPITSGNHGLGTDSSKIMVQLIEVATGQTVYTDVVRGASGLITITFGATQSVNAFRALLQKIA